MLIIVLLYLNFLQFFSPCWKQFGHMFSCCCCGILPVEIKIYLFDLTVEKHWDQYLIGTLVQPRPLEKPLLTNYWVASIYNRNSNDKKEGRPRQLTSWNLSASSLGAWFVALWYYVTSVYNLNWMRTARLSVPNVKLLRRRLAAQVAAHFQRSCEENMLCEQWTTHPRGLKYQVSRITKKNLFWRTSHFSARS